MIRFRLTSAHRRRLDQQLRAIGDAGLYRRTLAVLEAGAGRPVSEVARLVRTSRVSVYHWIDAFERACGPAGLVDRRGGNHPTPWTAELRAALADSLSHRPDR